MLGKLASWPGINISCRPSLAILSCNSVDVILIRSASWTNPLKIFSPLEVHSLMYWTMPIVCVVLTGECCFCGIALIFVSLLLLKLLTSAGAGIYQTWKGFIRTRCSISDLLHCGYLWSMASMENKLYYSLPLHMYVITCAMNDMK